MIVITCFHCIFHSINTNSPQVTDDHTAPKKQTNKLKTYSSYKTTEQQKNINTYVHVPGKQTTAGDQ